MNSTSFFPIGATRCTTPMLHGVLYQRRAIALVRVFTTDGWKCAFFGGIKIAGHGQKFPLGPTYAGGFVGVPLAAAATTATTTATTTTTTYLMCCCCHVLVHAYSVRIPVIREALGDTGGTLDVEKVIVRIRCHLGHGRYLVRGPNKREALTFFE